MRAFLVSFEMRAACLLLIVLGLTASSGAAELKQKTVEAFEDYIAATELRMTSDLANQNGFLWLDGLPEQRRGMVYDRLRRGNIVVKRLETRRAGKHIIIPDGLVHHWIGVVFVPGVTLPQAVAVLRDYSHHDEIYKSEIERSTVLNGNGNNFRVRLRIHHTSIVSAVYNADVEIQYFPVSSTREWSRSRSIRIAEVENVGRSEEHGLHRVGGRFAKSVSAGYIRVACKPVFEENPNRVPRQFARSNPCSAKERCCGIRLALPRHDQRTVDHGESNEKHSSVITEDDW